MLLLLSLAHAETVSEVDLPDGPLVEVQDPGVDCSSGVVLGLSGNDVEVRDMRAGRVIDERIPVKAAVESSLRVGERVLVYREEAGVTVAVAR